MSNEIATNETTPLRIKVYNAEPITTIEDPEKYYNYLRRKSKDTTHHHHNQYHNQQQQQQQNSINSGSSSISNRSNNCINSTITTNSSGNNNKTVTTTTTTNSYNSNSSNNNNKSNRGNSVQEITSNNSYININNNNRFDPERPPGDSPQELQELQLQQRQQQEQQHLHNNNNNNQRQEIMETNRQILQKVIIDFIVLLCVGFPILFFFLFGEPYKRGFFCDDESLMHPFHDSTVKSWMLYIIGLVLPIAIILGTEYIQSTVHGKPPTLRFLDWNIPDFIVQSYKQIGIFGFGAGISQLTTDIAKYSIGRLRPHFIEVCKPIFHDRTNCSDTKNLGVYHEIFECSNPLSTKRMIKEMRLSFPSGHSSFSVYAMVYCAIYLHSRMTWHGSKLLKHFLQFVLVMLAWATALSRISNYKHHWSDVLAGALIGALCALTVANYISDLCGKKFNKSSTFPTTQPPIIMSSTASGTSPTSYSRNGRV